MFRDFFRNKTALVTGHTGFKGAWLCEWLLALGANVHGYALDPKPWHTLYTDLKLSERIDSDERGDLSEVERLTGLVRAVKPECVFHLAAQPLVRASYEYPRATVETNVLGTVNVLEALRQSDHPCVGIMVTTDKCYANREWLHGYRESDPLGGCDPYSASKGAAEIIIGAYRDSFFRAETSPVRIASARAGNVIGGGDWAPDRIIPDCMRALRQSEAIVVRNRTSTRPWQHVLEPLSGYLTLASQISCAQSGHDRISPDMLSTSFNFGPALTSNRTVSDLVETLLTHTGGDWVDRSDPNALHEAGKLNLATDKAYHLLGWEPAWNFHETVEKTAQGYPAADFGEVIPELVRAQISEYQQAAAQRGIPWAASQ